jgi:hypothetical protein
VEMGVLTLCGIAALACALGAWSSVAVRAGATARWRQLVLVAGLLASLGLILRATSCAGGQRVVLIIDRGADSRGETPADTVLRALAPEKTFVADSVRLSGATPGTETPPEGAERAWGRGGAGFGVASLEPALVAGTPDDALRVAMGRFRELAWWESLADTMWGRQRRVVIVASDEAIWRRNALNVAEHVASALQRDVVVDVVRVAEGGDGASLEIEFSPAEVAPATPLALMNAEVIARLRSPQLARAPRGGPVTVRIEANIDGEGADSAPQLDLVLEGGTTTALWRDDGSLEARIPMARFRAASGGIAALSPGFHLVTVRMATVHPGVPAAGGAADRYLKAAATRAVVVVGTHRRLWPTLGVEADAAAQVERIREAINLPLKDKWPSGLSADIGVKGEAELASVLGSPPRLLLVHDLSDEVWKEHGEALRRAVENGMTLIVSVTPTDEVDPVASVSWLPALADNAKPVTVHRPALVFAFDDSRLSLMTGLVPVSSATGYVSGMSELVMRTPMITTQRAFAEALVVSLREKLGDAKGLIKASAVAPASLAKFDDPSEHFVRLATKDVSVWNETTKFQTDLQLANITGKLDSVNAALAASFGLPDGSNARASAVVVVLFVWDVALGSEATEAIKAACERGWIVCPVLLKSPFADPRPVAGEAPKRPATQVLDELVGSGESGRRTSRVVWTGASQCLTMAESPDVATLAETLAGALKPLLDAKGQVIVRGGAGRLLDERHSPQGLPGAALTPDQAARARPAPLRSQSLIVRSGLDAGAVAWLEATHARRGPEPVVGAAGVLGHGQVLCLGYSMFEPLDVPVIIKDAIATGGWDNGVRPVFSQRADASGVWGLQRLLDPSVMFHGIEEPISARARVRSVRRVEATGEVFFDVVQRLDAGVIPRELSVDLTREENDAREVEPVSARLVDFDPARHRLSYSLLSADVRKKLESADESLGPRFAKVVLTSDGGPTEQVRFFLPKPPEFERDFGSLDALAILASYSGGSEVRSVADLQPVQIGLRIPLGLGAAAVVLAMFASRVARRIAVRRRVREVLAREPGQLGEQSGGGVTGAAELLSRAVPDKLVGAFAGYRVLDPGDRISGADRMDLLRFVGVVKVEGFELVIPRIPLRIDEQSRPLHIIVQCGVSMRTPGLSSSRPTKLLAAARAARVAAQVAAGRGAQVHVSLLGLASGAIVQTFSGDCGESVLEMVEHSALAAPAPARAGVPALPDEDAAVLYISDFLTEALDAAAELVRGAVSEGMPLGAVIVYAPSEYQLVDSGLTGGPRIWCDRTEWAPADVEALYRKLRREVGTIFEAATGGLCAVSTMQTDVAMSETFASSKLVELFR